MVAGEEVSMQEKLIEFIHSLTEEECKIIISHIKKEQS